MTDRDKDALLDAADALAELAERLRHDASGCVALELQEMAESAAEKAYAALAKG